MDTAPDAQTTQGVTIADDAEWATLTSFVGPPMTVDMEQLDELPRQVRTAVYDTVAVSCASGGVPFERVLSATFREGRVAEVTVRLD